MDQKTNVEIYFKIDGLETYITDLESLNGVLKQVSNSTDNVKQSTESFEQSSNNAVESIDRSKQSVQGFKGAVDVLGGSVEALVGGLGLLGAEPEWLKNVEDGATKSIAFADGISRLADGINDVREYLNNYTTAARTNTVAIEAQDAATKATTVSTRTLGTVLKGVGIGLVIAGIAALIANYDKLLGLLGIEKKVFDTSAKDRITQLEKELRIAELQGASSVELAVKEQELANLRRQNAKNYVNFLMDIGAEEDEINAAIDEAIQLQNDYEVAIEATAKARRDAANEEKKNRKEFDEYQKELINSEINSDPYIYGTEAYFNRVSESIKEETDDFLQSTKDRQKANQELTDILIGQAQLVSDNELDEYANLLEDKLISKETYDQLVLISENRLEEKLIEIKENAAKKDLQIQQEGIQKRFKLTADAISAIMALNEATAGATEQEQRRAFERNKKLQTGLALIQTAQAVTAALTAGGNPVKLATGAQFVEAAIVAATGLANVIKIQRTTFDGGGSVNLSTVNNTGINPQALLDQRNSQLEGGGGGTAFLRQRGDEPVRAYVVLNDINNAQQINNQILNLSKL